VSSGSPRISGGVNKNRNNKNKNIILIGKI
jgi:hypothetical protein